MTSVASKSMTIGLPVGELPPTPSRGPGRRLLGIARSSAEAVAWTARQAVATEATGPNSSVCSRSAAMSDRQSAPSAIATARWVRTTPGIVGVPGDPAVVHGLRHVSREPAAVGELGEESVAGVGDQVLPVGGHFRATHRSTTMHLQGALLLVRMRVW